MKKLAFLTVLVVAFALMSGVVMAAETPHGPFDANSAVCAACHRAHTSSAEYLLATPRVTTLCIGCHDGSGADTDVVDGRFVTGGTELGPITPSGYDHSDWGVDTNPLMGGGFNNMGYAAASSATTSKHMDPEATNVAATTFIYQWGNRESVSGAGSIGPSGGYTKVVLDCVDCHMPHRSPNYRMLRVKPTGYDGENLIAPEVAGRITSSTGVYNAASNPGRRYTEDSGMFNTQVSGTNSISKWCGKGCHDFYYEDAVRADNGSGLAGDGKSPNMQTNLTATYTTAVTEIAVANASFIGTTNSIVINGVTYAVTAVDANNVTIGTALVASGAAPVYAGTPVSIMGAGMGVYYNLDGIAGADPTFMHAVDVNLTYMPRNGSSTDEQTLGSNLAIGGYGTKMPVADQNGSGSYDDSDIMTCLTCHRAHGSDARMTGDAVLPARNIGAVAPAGSTAATNGSMLLRLENRAICQQCHQMPNGF